VREVREAKNQNTVLIIYTEPRAAVTVTAEGVRARPEKRMDAATDQGYVEFTDLKPGPYTVSVELEGFVSSETSVGIFAQKTATLNLTLEPVKYTVTIKTNVKDGEVRFAPAQYLGAAPDGKPKIRETGGYGVVSVINGQARIQNLARGLYAVRIRGPECDKYREVLASISVPDDLSPDANGNAIFAVDLDLGDPTKPAGTASDPVGQVSIAKQEFPSISFGKYYALIIGNDNYQNGIKPLKNAVSDATAVDEILRTKFGFETILLTDRTGKEIISAINRLKRNLTENDNLLVYYSGHGIRLEDETYWVPIDAVDAEDNTTWVSTSVHLVKNLRATRAKHVIVISDSCFAGTINARDLARDANAESGGNRQNRLQKIVDSVSRVLLASGGDEPVLDVGGGKHSIFTRALLEGLEKMDKKVFLASELFHDFIAEQVSGSAKQTPEFAPIRESGHVKGEFVFVRAQ
jgi:hypothetical protein